MSENNILSRVALIEIKLSMTGIIFLKKRAAILHILHILNI